MKKSGSCIIVWSQSKHESMFDLSQKSEQLVLEMEIVQRTGSCGLIRNLLNAPPTCLLWCALSLSTPSLSLHNTPSPNPLLLSPSTIFAGFSLSSSSVQTSRRQHHTPSPFILSFTRKSQNRRLCVIHSFIPSHDQVRPADPPGREDQCPHRSGPVQRSGLQ